MLKCIQLFLLLNFIVLNCAYAGNIYSRQTGNWTDVTSPGTWSTAGLGGADCNCTPAAGDNVIIGNGNVVTFDAGSNTTINSLQINAGGSKLTMTASNRLIVNTNIILNGTIDGASTSNVEIAATTAGSTLSGTGTFSMSSGDLKVINNITILAGSDIKFTNTGKFRLNANTITNNGKIEIIDPSDLTNTAGNVWINAASTSYLYYASNTNFGANNILTSTAVGNTVEFGMNTGSFNMDLTGSYYNLVISGAGGTKKLKNNITVAGDLTINAGATNILDLSIYNITLYGNFTNNGTFTAGSQALTLNGTTAQQVSGTTTFYDLTINNSYATSPQVTLGSNITVQNTLTMTRGNVDLNGKTLTLGSSTAAPGTLSYAAGFLYGSTGTFTRWISSTSAAIGAVASNELGHFPMGTSSGDYRPFWLTYTADLTAGGTVSALHDPTTLTISASHTDASWSGGTALQAVSNSNWVISTANGFTLNGASGNIRYGGTGFGTNTLTDLDATLLASTVGTFSAATSVNTAIEVNRTALTTANLANTWRIGTKDPAQSPLPIRLISFDAALNKNKVDLKWITATETNNDFFTVERSQDGNNFDIVSTVKGAGNSTSVLNYSSIDDNPYPGISYYRLKQTDFDGNYSYSNLATIKFNKTDDFNLNVFPNPSVEEENINLSFSANKGEEVLVVVYDATCKKSYSKVVVVQTDGNNVFAIDDSGALSRGVYMITATSNQNIYSKKLIVK